MKFFKLLTIYYFSILAYKGWQNISPVIFTELTMMNMRGLFVTFVVVFVFFMGIQLILIPLATNSFRLSSFLEIVKFNLKYIRPAFAYWVWSGVIMYFNDKEIASLAPSIQLTILYFILISYQRVYFAKIRTELLAMPSFHFVRGKALMAKEGNGETVVVNEKGFYRFKKFPWLFTLSKETLDQTLNFFAKRSFLFLLLGLFLSPIFFYRMMGVLMLILVLIVRNKARYLLKVKSFFRGDKP